jgi:transposase
MLQTKRKHSEEFKARVSLECLREKQTIEEISHKYELHPSVVKAWKKQAVENLKQVFGNGDAKQKKDEISIEKLYAQIGQLKVENDFLKKKLF